MFDFKLDFSDPKQIRRVGIFAGIAFVLLSIVIYSTISGQPDTLDELRKNGVREGLYVEQTTEDAPFQVTSTNPEIRTEAEAREVLGISDDIEITFNLPGVVDGKVFEEGSSYEDAPTTEEIIYNEGTPLPDNFGE